MPRHPVLGAASVDRETGRKASRNGAPSLWVNRALALLKMPVAAFTLIFALGAVIRAAACTTQPCPSLGRSGFSVAVLYYAAQAIAVVVIALSFFTARLRWVIAVPLCGLTLLVADIIALRAAIANGLSCDSRA